MTHEELIVEFAEKMAAIDKLEDVGTRHAEADDLMCCILFQLGFGDGVAIYENMKKWYE